MARVALLFACHAALPEGEPSATVAVAGVTVIERQVRQARASEATRILVVVERMPPGLAAALARADVEIVRATSLRVEDDDQILLIADSLIVEARAVAATLAPGSAAIAVWKGRGAPAGAERLDAIAHWAGVAVCDGRLLNKVVASLGEWDLQATLLRRIAADARPVRVDLAAAGLDGAGWTLVDAGNVAEATRRELGAGDQERRDWPSLMLHKPLEGLLMSRLLERGVGVRAVALCGNALLAFACGLTVAGWPLVGLALALVAGPLAGIAHRIAHARQDRSADAGVGRLLDTVYWLSLAAYLARGHEPLGAVALAALVIAAGYGLLIIDEGCLAAAGKPVDLVAADGARLRRWGPHTNARRWTLLFFGVFNLWWTGLAVVAAYSAAGHLYTQRQAWNGMATRRDERRRRSVAAAPTASDDQLPFPPLTPK